MTPIEQLKHQMTLPVAESRDDYGQEGFFNPWEIFPSVYGSYSSGFDDMAIEVLESIASGDFTSEPLSHQIFREMLCTADLCDYGTSPRVCFPNWGSEFEHILPALIKKWKAHREMLWDD